MKHENTGKWIGKKTIVMMSAAIIAAGTLGGIAIADLSGVGLKLAQPTYAYELSADESAALTKANALGTVSDYSNTTLTAPEMVLAGIAKYKSYDTTMHACKGTAVTKVTILFSTTTVNQIVRSCGVHNYQKYFLESLSYSNQAECAHRAYEGYENGTGFYSLEGSVTDTTNAEKGSWNYDSSNLTSWPSDSKYAETYGKSPKEPVIYDISSSSVSSSTKAKSGSFYTVVLNMNESSFTDYKIQIKKYGGYAFKTFTSCALTFTLRSDLTLYTLGISEKYSVSGPLGTTPVITGNMTTYYHVGSSSYAYPGNTAACSSLSNDFDYSSATTAY
jgi:hypothetical protein